MAVAVAALMILTLVSPAAAQSFTDPVTYTVVNENPGRAAAGDLDGDGDLDLAVANTGYVLLLANNGDGTFAAPQSISLKFLDREDKNRRALNEIAESLVRGSAHTSMVPRRS